MGRRDLPPLRALPRLFVPEVDPEAPFELPKEEVDKLRKVLRLGPGAIIAVLPGDGSALRCEFRGHEAIPLDVSYPDVEPRLRLTLCQALPKGDKLDEIIRAGTEVGIARFVLFPSERSVVRWDAAKLEDRLRRLRTIAREAAEVAVRTRLPEIETATGLDDVLARFPDAEALSEESGLLTPLARRTSEESRVLVVGPEGGWDRREMAKIGDRARTLGPRVLRTEHAGFAAASLLLLPLE